MSETNYHNGVSYSYMTTNASSGNTTVAGTMDITGNTTVAGTMEITGDTFVDGDFYINTRKPAVSAIPLKSP